MKKLILLLFYLQSYLSFSQELYKINYIFTDTQKNVSHSTLFTNNKEAAFIIQDPRENGSATAFENKNKVDKIDDLWTFLYTNATTAYWRFPMYGEIAYKDDYVKKMTWKINPANKRKIGKYDCTEARIKLNGRFYSVWFTYTVPMKFGPLKFHSLPGLIIEVTEEGGNLKLAFEGMTKTKDLTEFNAYKNYFLVKKKIMTYPEYEKKVVEIEVAKRKEWFETQMKYNLKKSDLQFTIQNQINSLIEYPANLKSELKFVHE